MNKTLTHIDLFAGPGGIATGFKAAGIRTILANEYIDSVCDTYEANHPETEMIRGDIRELSDAIIKNKLLENNLNSVDIVSGGFPCETFSTAGSSSRSKNDHRNILYKEIIRIGNASHARVLMFENVPAFLTKKVVKGEKELYYDLLIKDLKANGYKYINFKILNASHYGVPQLRKRFILLASKTIDVGDMELPATSVVFTVDDAISDLPPIEDNLTLDIYRNFPQNDFQKIMRDPNFWGVKLSDHDGERLSYHITPKHRTGTKLRFELINPGEGLKDAFLKHSPKEILELQEKKILPKKWFIQRNHRLTASAPSKTVTSHALDELVHPFLNRALSVREVARLQGFPDWYDFKGGPLIAPHNGSIQDKYEQIGDAVPPLLARELALYLKKIMINQSATKVLETKQMYYS